jgi:hypothetical protein
MSAQIEIPANSTFSEDDVLRRIEQAVLDPGAGHQAQGSSTG